MKLKQSFLERKSIDNILDLYLVARKKLLATHREQLRRETHMCNFPMDQYNDIDTLINLPIKISKRLTKIIDLIK